MIRDIPQKKKRRYFTTITTRRNLKTREFEIFTRVIHVVWYAGKCVVFFFENIFGFFVNVLLSIDDDDNDDDNDGISFKYI